MTPLSPDPRFPTGTFQFDPHVTRDTRRAAIAAIRTAPAELRAAVQGLNETQLNTPYRPGGWTIRQVVHHVPESHMNAYIRMKMAATEDSQAIKTYEEQLWAELPDAKNAPAELSLSLLEALHRRWVLFLRNLSDAEYARTFKHPDWGTVTIDEAVALYEWHCRHHLAHVQQGLGIRN